MGIFPDIQTRRRKTIEAPETVTLAKGGFLLAVGITAVSAVVTDIDPLPKMLFAAIGVVCGIIGALMVGKYTKGYKAFKEFIPRWDAGRGIYDRFAEEFNAWQREGKKPTCCDGDISYYLQLQRQRLQKKGIRMHDRIVPAKGRDSGTATASWKSLWYTTNMSYENVHRKIGFSNEQGTLYEREVDQVMYEMIVHTPNDEQTERITVTCPNCGSLSPVRDLEDGCRYCGTRFEIKDLFPKVVNLFFIKNDVETNPIVLKTVLAVMLVLFVISAGFGVVSMKEIGELPALFALSFAITFICGGIVGYPLGCILLVAAAMDRDGRKRMSPAKWLRTKTRITQTLRKYEPSFSYNKFEGQLVSLIRMVVFADDPEELACYQGTERDVRFEDILEMTYTNGTILQQIKQEGNQLRLFLRTWWINYSEKNGTVEKTGDCIDVIISRDITKTEEPGFSITSVQCRTCGGSFDAVRQKKCPYCGNEYHMEKESWTVEKIELIR